MFETSQMQSPLTAREFEQALDRYDGDGIGAVVDDVWPVVTDRSSVSDQSDATYTVRTEVSSDQTGRLGSGATWEPSYREHQRETVIESIEKLYVEDNDVLLLSAPTGAGKSLLIYSICAVIDALSNRKSFITTPLNTLIDQMEHDEFLHDVITIKGRNNYDCVHPEDRGTSVDSAICQRDDDFECRYKNMPHTSGGCPYYGRKMVAQTRSKVVTNLSFLMANSMIPEMVDAGLDPRELLAVDECIPKGEVVTTADGRQVEIERFKCEENISVDMSDGSLHRDSVEAVKQTSTKDCVRVHATRGSFMASHDHQMKDVDEWTDASDLDRVARPLCRVSTRPDEEIRASILGYWFGDGWISTSTGVSGDVVDLERIDDAVRSIYGYEHTSTRSVEASGSVDPINGSRRSIDGVSNTYNYSASMGQALQDDGLPSGDKTLQDCHIPDFDTDSEVKAFIAGFFGAEGYVPSQASDRSFDVIKASRYTTGDCVFFEEMASVLDSFGIESYIESTDGNIRSDGTETTRYELIIGSGRENMYRFLSEIGFEYCRRKEIEAASIECFLGDYLAEIDAWVSDYHDIIESCEERGWEYGAVSDEVLSRGYGERMKSYISKRSEPKSITEFPTYSEWCDRYVDGDIVYERVHEIERIGERECYDITVSDNHNFLVGDEYVAHNCQNIEDFALMFVGFTLGENLVPIDWDDLSTRPAESWSMDRTVEWISTDLMNVVVDEINDLESRKESLTFGEKDQDRLERLRRFKGKVDNFLQDVRNHHWTKSHTDFDGWKVEFKPIFVGRFLDGFLWSQANKVLASSATIPPSFVEEVGLDDWAGGSGQIARIDVESTFPAERRPIITTESVGKMSYHQRDQTMPKMADQIGRIADVWEGHKGFVHCHSYDIADKIYQRLPHEIQQRTTLQDGDDREGSLDAWIETDVDATSPYKSGGGQVFLSVAMDEGISLDDDRARWQVVAKTAYPHMKDERVAYRMDEDTMNGTEWNWYAAKAAINLQQAVGRGMRSKDDWCATYLLDDSSITLINRNKHLFEDWFLDAVDCDFDEQVVSPSNY